jgi:ribosome-associated translation inhibitor RaiA
MDDSKKVVWLVNQMMNKFTKFPICGATATVVVDETHHKESQSMFQVTVKLSVPGERLYTARSSEGTGMTDGVFRAIAKAFDNVERQLVRQHDKRSRRRAKAYIQAA